MIERTARANLIRIATVYAKATDSTLSTVSRRFYGKAQFLKDFKRGKVSMTLSNFDRLLAAFRKNWPSGVPWPETAPILMDGSKPEGSPGGLFAAFQGMRKVSPRLNARA